MSAKVLNIFRPSAPLTGRFLSALTVAHLSVLGMLETPRKDRKPVVRPARAINAVYHSSTMLKHHRSKGNFAEAEDGYVLTEAGRKFFRARVGAGIESSDVKEAEAAIRKGGSYAGVQFEPIAVEL